MRNLTLKNVIHTILALCFVSFLASCNPDDNSIEITKIETNKKNAFIEETITLNLEGTGYKDINLTSNTTAIKFNQVSPTSYEITSTIATTAYIYVKLSNDADTVSKTIILDFFNHGVTGFNTAEGIKINDASSKVLDLLGAPTQKTTSPAIEIWSYPLKGISIKFQKYNNGGVAVNSISLLSSNFYITQENDTKMYYTDYSYDLGNTWKINNINTKMDAVITRLGQPTKKESSTDPSSTLRTYTFSNNTKFSFYGATEDDSAGKVVQSVTIFSN